MHDSSGSRGRTRLRAVSSRTRVEAAWERELGLIAQDLAAKPQVESVVLAVAGPNGAADVLSAAGDCERPVQRSHEFVSRAVRAERPMVEPIDTAKDGSLGRPSSLNEPTYAISVPVRVDGTPAAALCVGISGRRPASDADLLWVVNAYARLAAACLGERRPGAPALGAGRDEVTGCLTYAAVLHQLDLEIDRCARLDLELTCGFVGMSPSAVGRSNRSLAAIGRALRSVVAQEDSVGRYGAEQFIVVLPGTNLEAALPLGERFARSLRAIDGGRGPDGRVGVAQWVPGTRVDRLLGDADRALGFAMRKGVRKVSVTG